MDRLKLALVHLDVRHGDAARNRNEMLLLTERAAGNGAGIIVNTELAVSGYSFSSREEIAGLVETKEGPTISALKTIASRYACFVVAGYPEKDEETGIYYNSTAVIGPEGVLLLNYRKITAEVRWACSGSPLQNNVFSTPWGTAGVMICSDTYYGAIPRMASLKGVDLLLVPANWPGGSLDPRELWQVRARENGYFLAACNRSGKDKTMSCEEAWSCVYGPDGEKVLEASSCISEIFYAELPLDGGKLTSFREKQLVTRKPSMFAPIYLDMRYATDLTIYYKLPEPAQLNIACHSSGPEELSSGTMLENIVENYGGRKTDMVVLPSGKGDDREMVLKRLSRAARKYRVDICSGFYNEKNGEELVVFAGKNGELLLRTDKDRELTIIDLDSVRIALLCKTELYHPETVIACAKQGCDLVLCSSAALDDLDRKVLGARTIEQAAVAVSGHDRSFICQPPEGHHRWAETSAEGGKGFVTTLDIGKLREKNYFDRIDYEILLKKRD